MERTEKSGHMVAPSTGGEPHRIRRPRLASVLESRHTKRLIAIKAPAGYGKSTLLEQVVFDGPERPTDVDVFLDARIVPNVDDFVAAVRRGVRLESLVSDIRTTSDASTTNATSDGSTIGIPALLGRFPGEVAIIVDAVEGASAEVLRFLETLVVALPSNGHLVVAGRSLPNLATASRVAVGEALLLDQFDLRFTADELTDLIAATFDEDRRIDATMRLSVDPELVSWPLGASIDLLGARQRLDSLVFHDILQTQPAGVAVLLSALVLIGGGDAELVKTARSALHLSPNTAELVSDLPLVIADGGGRWPHERWREAVSSVLTEAQSDAVIDAVVDVLVARRDFHRAADLCVRGNRSGRFAKVVLATLATSPPLVATDVLHGWADLELLDKRSPEGLFLSGVLGLHLGADPGATAAALDAARGRFAEDQRHAAELCVIFHLGVLARRADDLGSLGRLLVRSRELGALGDLEAAALARLGDAVAAQIGGDSETALRIVDSSGHHLLRGDWAQQVRMIRGANLAVLGRVSESVAELEAASAFGSLPGRAVAHRLAAIVLWGQGDVVRARQALQLAASLLGDQSTTMEQSIVGALRSAIDSLTDPGLGDVALREIPVAPYPSREVTELTATARAALAVHAGELDEARKLLLACDLPTRVTTATTLRIGLEVALLPERREYWERFADRFVSARPGADAGLAAAAFLEGSGPFVNARLAHYVPSCWAEAPARAVRVTLLGSAAVSDRAATKQTDGWRRGRVRELACFLALRGSAGRPEIAAAIWPELGDDAARANLRVTLTHLLDVLAPDRPPRSTPDFVLDDGSALAFRRSAGIRIDLWDLSDVVDRILGDGVERSTMLLLGRQLLSMSNGTLLAGASLGEWAEPYARRLTDRSTRAALRAAEVALDHDEVHLAADLARWALAHDRWSEAAHRLIVLSRLQSGDRDGARRAMQDLITLCGDLGVGLDESLRTLARQLGIRDLFVVDRLRRHDDVEPSRPGNM